MLTKEKLSEIFNKAIESRNYFCKVEPSSTKNSCTIRLYDGQPMYDGQPNDDELVANVYLSEGKVLGSFHVSFIPERSNKGDREVLRIVNSQLFDYVNEQLEPKYYIKLLNDDYGYLVRDEDTESWSVISLELAQTYNKKVAFTDDEIMEMSKSEEFANVDLWSAAKEVEYDDQEDDHKDN